MADPDYIMSSRTPPQSHGGQPSEEPGGQRDDVDQDLRQLYQAYGDGPIPEPLKALAEKLEKAASDRKRADETDDARSGDGQ